MLKQLTAIRNYDKYTIPIIVIINFFITVFLSLSLNIWIDEACSLKTTENDLALTIKNALYFELQAPLYYIILKIWRSFSDSLFFARLLSTVFNIFTIIFLSKLSKKLFKEINPGWVTVAIAFNPFFIWYGAEVRVYSLVMLFSTLLLLMFVEGYISEETKIKKRNLYLIFSVLALYTHYYLGFLLLANGLVLVLLRRWKSMSQYLLGMAIVAICFAPMLLILHYQKSSHVVPGYMVSYFNNFKIVYWRIKDYILPSGEGLKFFEISKMIFPVWVVGGLIYVLKKWRSFFIPYNAVLLSATGVLSFFFIIFISFYGRDLAQPRHTTVLFIPAILLSFSVLINIRKKVVYMTIGLIIFTYYGISIENFFNKNAKDGDWKRVSQFLMEKENKSEPILILRNWGLLPLSYYYQGKNILIPIPNSLKWDTYDISSQVIDSEKIIDEALNNESEKKGRFWLVTYQTEPYLGIDIKPEIIERYIEKCCSVIKDQKFYETKVRYLEFKKLSSTPN